jgi:chitinase
MTYKLIGYFENWAQWRPGKGKFSPKDIDPLLFTHINYAFAFFGFETAKTEHDTGKLTGDYKVYPVESNDQDKLYPALQALKETNKGLKTSLSIGGWSFNDNTNPKIGQKTLGLFSKMVSNPEYRQQFIESAIGYARTHKFDGIDLDWEYPGVKDHGGNPADFENFPLLLKEFQAKKSGLLLTITPAAVNKGKASDDEYFGWLATGCAQHVDWFNVMCYDYHGAFPPNLGTGANAPLANDSDPNGTWCVAHTIEGYLKAKVPPDKIVLGMPTYGHTFKGVKGGQGKGFNQEYTGAGDAGPSTGAEGFLAYYEIQGGIDEGTLTEHWDDYTQTPYADNASGDFVSYDNEKSVGLKASYLVGKGLAGAMVWAIAEDHFHGGTYPLVKKIKTILDSEVPKPMPGCDYTIVSGDTLFKIAQSAYGEDQGNRWHEIYEANKDKIHDPKDLVPGTQIYIPKL